jgi:hypothetical protein
MLFPTAKSLLGNGTNELPVDQKTGRCIGVKRIQAENDAHAEAPVRAAILQGPGTGATGVATIMRISR